MASNRPNHECLPKPSPLLWHTTFFLKNPYHSLPCTLTSQRNNTKQSPAWCLCPPRVYSGNGGACWDQSGEHRPHYCRTRRQTGGRELHQPPDSLTGIQESCGLCCTNWITVCFQGRKLRGNHSAATDDTLRCWWLFPACGACSLCRTRGQDEDQSTQLLFSSTGIISRANGRDIKVNKLHFFMTVTAQSYHWFCWFALSFYSLEKKQGSKSVLLRWKSMAQSYDKVHNNIYWCHSLFKTSPFWSDLHNLPMWGLGQDAVSK